MYHSIDTPTALSSPGDRYGNRSAKLPNWEMAVMDLNSGSQTPQTQLSVSTTPN